MNKMLLHATPVKYEILHCWKTWMNNFIPHCITKFCVADLWYGILISVKRRWLSCCAWWYRPTTFGIIILTLEIKEEILFFISASNALEPLLTYRHMATIGTFSPIWLNAKLPRPGLTAEGLIKSEVHLIKLKLLILVYDDTQALDI